MEKFFTEMGTLLLVAICWVATIFTALGLYALLYKFKLQWAADGMHALIGLSGWMFLEGIGASGVLPNRGPYTPEGLLLVIFGLLFWLIGSWATHHHNEILAAKSAEHESEVNRQRLLINGLRNLIPSDIWKAAEERVQSSQDYIDAANESRNASRHYLVLKHVANSY